MIHFIFFSYIDTLMIIFASTISSIMVMPLMRKTTWYPQYIFFQGALFLFNLLFTAFFYLQHYINLFSNQSNNIPISISILQILFYLLISFQIYLIYLMFSGILYKGDKKIKIMINTLGISLVFISFISGLIGGIVGKYLALSLIFGVSQIPLVFIILKWNIVWNKKENRLVLIIPFAAIVVFPIMIIEYVLTGALENKSLQLFTMPIGKISFSVFCYIIAVGTIIHNVKYIFKYTKTKASANSYDLTKSFIEFFNITKREQDIILSLKQGMGHKQIADKLHISTRTVGTHLSNIYKKCEVNSMVELLNCIEMYKSNC